MSGQRFLISCPSGDCLSPETEESIRESVDAAHGQFCRIEDDPKDPPLSLATMDQIHKQLARRFSGVIVMVYDLPDGQTKDDDPNVYVAGPVVVLCGMMNRSGAILRRAIESITRKNDGEEEGES